MYGTCRSCMSCMSSRYADKYPKLCLSACRCVCMCARVSLDGGMDAGIHACLTVLRGRCLRTLRHVPAPEDWTQSPIRCRGRKPYPHYLAPGTGPFIPTCRGQDPYPHYLTNDDANKDDDDDQVYPSCPVCLSSHQFVPSQCV